MFVRQQHTFILLGRFIGAKEDASRAQAVVEKIEFLVDVEETGVHSKS